jgi:hypothetical protein
VRVGNGGGCDSPAAAAATCAIGRGGASAAINYQAILGCAAVAPHDKLAAGLIFLAITRRTSRRLNRGIDRLIPGDAR